MSNYQDRRQAALSFKELRDLSPQIKRKWLYLLKTGIVEFHGIYQNSRLKFFGITAVLEYLYSIPHCRTKIIMIRYLYAGCCHIKTGAQGIISVKNPCILYHF